MLTTSRIRSRLWLTTSFVALVFTGCDSSRVEVETYENEGSACLVPPDSELRPTRSASEIEAGESAAVRVVFNECESYCANIEEATCGASRDGDVIQVTSHAKTREVIEDDGDCATACLIVSATCPVGSLEAGSYTIRHGETTRSVEVPGSDIGTCYSYLVSD